MTQNKFPIVIYIRLSFFSTLMYVVILASDESRVISYDKLKILLHSLDDFPWSLVDYAQLDYMANLVSERYNAFCLLKKFSMEPKGRIVEDQRYSALRLLQLVSCVPLVDENFRV